MSHSYLRSLLTIGALCLSFGAFAQAQAAPVISGGVAEEGRAAIEAKQNAYSLKVTYAGQGGMFLSDVDVVIRDRAGNVVANTTTNGPIVLADLAPGSYTLESSVNGITKTQRVSVGHGLKQITVRFDIGEENYDSNNRAVRGVSYWQDESRITHLRGGYPESATHALNASDAGDASVTVYSDEYIPGGRAVQGMSYEPPNYYHPFSSTYHR